MTVMTPAGSAIAPPQQDMFLTFAQQVIPDRDGFPSVRDVELQTSGLDRLRSVRADLYNALVRALQHAAEHGVSDVFELRSTHVAHFDAICNSAAAIYLTDQAVSTAFGYPGRVAQQVGDPHARIAVYEELVAPVVERGFIWKSL